MGFEIYLGQDGKDTRIFINDQDVTNDIDITRIEVVAENGPVEAVLHVWPHKVVVKEPSNIGIVQEATQRTIETLKRNPRVKK